MSFPKPFNFQWTESAVSEFWNRLAGIPGIENQYFSLQRGKSVLNYLSKNADLKAGTILDLGCGQGHMLAHLLNRGITCMGLDTSSRSVLEANRRLSSRDLFRGARLMESFDRIPLESGSIHGVLLMETIEHLFEDKIHNLLLEIRRVLRPNGFVLVTTPNNENLDANQAVCLNCGCNFHPVQHMRSYDAPTLSMTINRAGFNQQSCEPVIFMPNFKIYLAHLKHRAESFCPSCGLTQVHSKKTNIISRVLNLQIHTLTYIGRNQPEEFNC